MTHRGPMFRAEDDIGGSLQRLADSACIILAHVIVALAYKGDWFPEMTVATAVAVAAYIVVGEVNGLYKGWRSERMNVELRQALVTWVIVCGITIGFLAAEKTTGNYSRGVTFGWFGAAALALALERTIARIVLRRVRERGHNLRRVAVFGTTRGAMEIQRTIEQRAWLGMRVDQILDDAAEGALDALVRAARDGEIDIVYVALPTSQEQRIGEVLSALADTTASVYIVTDVFTYDLMHGRWSMLGNVPLVSVYDSPFVGPAGLIKRTEDVVFGSIILLLIAVPLLVIALAVKLTSKGPVLFRQRRYGLNGREIRVLKFRTMTVCEDGPVIKQATKNDARVTKLGRILRRTSLDELPQFLQVITGEMSIVGPRPHPVAQNEQYRALIHGYMLRHKVKPGITGWAQVNGLRGETETIDKMERRVEHDLEYIQNWNLFWDLKIIGLTIFGRKKNLNAY